MGQQGEGVNTASQGGSLLRGNQWPGPKKPLSQRSNAFVLGKPYNNQHGQRVQ